MEENKNLIVEVKDIDVSLIDSFPNHLLKVIEDDKMLQLTEIIMNNGLLCPVLVREKAEDAERIKEKLDNSQMMAIIKGIADTIQ